MGMYVIAAEGFWLADPQNWLTMLQVALGLGFVIFVHELGHFAVAKMCGVKCEKFYLGFDIYGLKLFKKQFRFTGGEIVGEFLMSLGYLPGAHNLGCPVHDQLEKLNPPWIRAKRAGFAGY